jgi:hypothetical protein
VITPTREQFIVLLARETLRKAFAAESTDA